VLGRKSVVHMCAGIRADILGVAERKDASSRLQAAVRWVMGGVSLETIESYERNVRWVNT
jgi:hypothetical protein